jgi:hypothetical protein
MHPESRATIFVPSRFSPSLGQEAVDSFPRVREDGIRFALQAGQHGPHRTQPYFAGDNRHHDRAATLQSGLAAYLRWYIHFAQLRDFGNHGHFDPQPLIWG